MKPRPEEERHRRPGSEINFLTQPKNAPRIRSPVRAVARYNAYMQPTHELVEALEREQVEDARRQSPAQKLLLGGDLFDAAREVMLSGIRAQYPGISDERAMEIVRQRLELARQLETRL